jgi:hypothetical protein
MPRSTVLLVALASCIAMSTGASGKRPEPITCPADVGASIGETCPCDGRVMPDLSVQPWRNHGQYVSCVVRYRNALRKAGCFTDDSTRRTIARCAARSTCGKVAKVRCCTYTPGTCSDPAPGDLVAAGTCSNDVTVPCDVDADCTTSSARIVRDADACTLDGGVPVDGGSVCDSCPPLPVE